jgi:hypothetical protein
VPNDDQPRDVVLFQPFLRPVDGSTKKVGVINTLMLKNWLSRRHKDVLEVTRKDALDIVNVSDAVSRLDADERDTIVLTDSIGRMKEVLIISEPSLYKLSAGSTKPGPEAQTARFGSRGEDFVFARRLQQQERHCPRRWE